MDGINWHTVLFLFFGLLACGFALAVVFSGNIVRMAFYLILSLGTTAGLFFLAGADFVGAMQLMIYVGGTLVLLIFGVMLTAKGPFVSLKTGGGDWVLTMLVGVPLLLILVTTVTGVEAWKPPAAPAAEQAQSKEVVTATRIGLGLLGARVDQMEQPDEVRRKGMSGYLLPFEIISFHLLVVLIGAAYLARTKKKVSPSEQDVLV